MKRELKFRIWNKQTKKFETNGSTIYDLGSAYQLWFDENGEIYEIQQYTGLKDKNDKEIYEGDIIKICLNDDPEDLQWELGSVTYKECCFWFDNISPQMLYDFVEDDKLMVEVVGNIFENSELLK